MGTNPHDELAEHYISVGREAATLDLIRVLITHGLDPRTIESIGIPSSQITQVLSVHFEGKIRVPEDEELVAEARKLAKKTLAKASVLMDVAPLPVQINLMKSVMPAIGRLIGNDAGASFEQAYAALSDLFSQQRVDVAPSIPLPSLTSGPTPSLIPTDDSDEGSNS